MVHEVYFVFLFLLLLRISLATAQFNTKIVGGTSVDIVNFPFTLSLRYYALHTCGASAIASTFAISAAHCLDYRVPAEIVSFSFSTNKYLREKNNFCIFFLFLFSQILLDHITRRKYKSSKWWTNCYGFIIFSSSEIR